VLRQPLEDGVLTITKAAMSVMCPACFFQAGAIIFYP
jgi:predicted ATPase with chaperone activity